MDKPPVLVVQTAFLGDFLLTLPMLQELSKKFAVHVVSRTGFKSLTVHLNCIAQHYEVKKGDSVTYKKLVQNLKKIEFEYIYCPHPSFRSAWLTWQLKAKHKVGYSNWWQSWAFSRSKKRQSHWPEPLRLIDLVTKLDPFTPYDELNHTNKGSMLSIPTEFEYSNLSGISSLQSKEKIKQAAIFFGSQWGTKQWPIEYYLKVATFLREDGYSIKWFGSVAEGEELKLILPQSLHNEVVAGQLSLAQVVTELSRSEFCLSNDSGGGHLAALSGTKVFSFFGPTSLKFGYRPWTNQLYIFEEANLKCRPCHHHGPKICPLKHHQCLKNILPNRVLSQLSN